MCKPKQTSASPLVLAAALAGAAYVAVSIVLAVLPVILMAAIGVAVASCGALVYVLKTNGIWLARMPVRAPALPRAIERRLAPLAIEAPKPVIPLTVLLEEEVIPVTSSRGPAR